MKKKIISIILVLIMLLSYSTTVFALTYTRNGGENLTNKASLITDEIYVDHQYNAESVSINGVSNLAIYNYGTTTPQVLANNDGTSIFYEGNENKYYYHVVQNSVGDYIYYAIKIGAGEKTYTNIATVVYKNAIKYEGQLYDVKLNIKEISKTGTGEPIVLVRMGKREHSDTLGLYDRSTYTAGIRPYIHVADINGTNTNVEIKAEYCILNSNGSEKAISGIFALDDVDLNQGIFINGFVASNNGDNIFVNKTAQDEQNVTNPIKYKQVGSGTYFYADNDADTISNNAYALIDNKSKVDMTLTWEEKNAGSDLYFIKGVLKTYHTVKTQVTGGTTTTPLINEIRDGENKTTSFSPENSNKYLKSITDNENTVQITNPSMNQYTVSNITEDHNIVVVYADKLRVVHDPKGGTPTPAVQYVIPNEKATTVTQPTRTGYTFVRWQKTGETTAYNYATPVTTDTTLEAVWTPVSYKITYVTNGGVNNPKNPGTYTVEDIINFQNPTRDGYDFLGWYSDENLTTPKDGISHETGDKIVYAKWKAKQDTKYKVEHYKETTNGKYELVVTDELTADTDSNVVAKPKTYAGFVENTTHKDRIPSGTVKSDGSLVLKLYYNKIKYTVTFDTKGGSKNPSDQKVAYNDKATKPTKPTKTGYTFQYWYYIENGKEIQYNFNDPVTKDIDLFAKWAQKAPTVLPNTGEEKNINSGVYMIAGITVIALAGYIFKRKYDDLKNI